MISLEYARSGVSGAAALKRTLLVSLALHLLALSVLFFSPSLPSRQWTFGPAYSVDLVSAPSALRESGTAATASRDAVSKALRESFKEDTIILKKNIRTTPPPAIKKHSEKDDTGRVDKAVDDIRRKVASAEKKGDPGPAGPSGQGQTNSRLMDYYSSIWSRIRSQWALPQSLLQNEKLEAVIEVRISRSGAVTSAQFEKRSGNSYFDSSAMRAVKKASPLPPLPEWVRDDSVELGIRFRSSDYRK